MRDLKFKMWDGCGIMSEPMTLTDIVYEENNGQVDTQNENFIFLQYTGLKDKNGKEIFEGDLLCMNSDTTAYYEVFYHNNDGYFSCARSHYNSSRCGGYIPSLNNGKLEIIGNIYENPDLLT